MRPLKFLACLVVFAATLDAASAAESIPADRTVTGLHVYPTFFVVAFDPPYANREGCQGPRANAHVVIPYVYAQLRGQPSGRNLYAAALAAYLGAKRVGFGISGCGSWGGGVPIGYRIDVVDGE